MPQTLARRIQQITQRGTPEMLGTAAQRRTVEDAFLFAGAAYRNSGRIGDSEISRLADSLARLYAELPTPPMGLGLEGKMGALLDEAISRRGWLDPNLVNALRSIRDDIARVAARKHRQFIG